MKDPICDTVYGPPEGVPWHWAVVPKEFFGFLNIDSCLHASHYQVHICSQRQKIRERMLPEGHFAPENLVHLCCVEKPINNEKSPCVLKNVVSFFKGMKCLSILPGHVCVHFFWFSFARNTFRKFFLLSCLFTHFAPLWYKRNCVKKSIYIALGNRASKLFFGSCTQGTFTSTSGVLKLGSRILESGVLVSWGPANRACHPLGFNELLVVH